MITVRLLGGLGNQLFQLSGMLYLQSQGWSVRCDTSWYAPAVSVGDTPRAFEIGRLLEKAEQYRLPAHIARLVYSVRNPRLLRETGPSDDLLNRLPGRVAWMEGYYQRAAYPTQVRGELQRRLLPVLESQPAVGVKDDVIGVHVRLGDYVTSSSTNAHHAVTGPSYFAQAIQIARDQVGDLPVRVFTDSPEIVASGYLRSASKSIEVSQSTASWDALRDLSACSAVVMSNSSFSWWAAFIAVVLRDRKIPVVMPQPWFAAPSAADDLLRVDGWSQIPRSMERRL